MAALRSGISSHTVYVRGFENHGFDSRGFDSRSFESHGFERAWFRILAISKMTAKFRTVSKGQKFS